MTDTGNAVGDEVVEELTEAILEPVLTAALDAFRMSDRIARTPECKALKSEDDQLQYITDAIVARARSASLPTGADWTEPTTQNLKTALSHWSAKLRRNADLDAEPQPADNTLYWDFGVDEAQGSKANFGLRHTVIYTSSIASFIWQHHSCILMERTGVRSPWHAYAVAFQRAKSPLIAFPLAPPPLRPAALFVSDLNRQSNRQLSSPTLPGATSILMSGLSTTTLSATLLNDTLVTCNKLHQLLAPEPAVATTGSRRLRDDRATHVARSERRPMSAISRYAASSKEISRLATELRSPDGLTKAILESHPPVGGRSVFSMYPSFDFRERLRPFVEQLPVEPSLQHHDPDSFVAPKPEGDAIDVQWEYEREVGFGFITPDEAVRNIETLVSHLHQDGDGALKMLLTTIREGLLIAVSNLAATLTVDET
ncbi:uncharacterized protein MKK02DRAFT_31440 [Dioszegia hungarica]|uniref:Uncharacterized protein n=1 Tax=Dioszegia hungarica TaxID=4972 RepID=A0AA38HCY2_9TREE|nr:uncharacterized protein MKK02DRAFT_31440 [Dioszegia hungarica]KAI9637893.1 hypothetical protein MKK02DRAFT_31440 [Dioszegia hungarica]